jgi:hypothetical protein
MKPTRLRECPFSQLGREHLLRTLNDPLQEVAEQFDALKNIRVSRRRIHSHLEGDGLEKPF